MEERYNNVAIALHWILAVGILCQIGLGWYLLEVPRGTPARTVWVNFHKSVGLTLATLILVRVAWWFTHRSPPLPASMPPWERLAARANHTLLYVCMVGMPLTGYIASNFSKFGIRYFFLVDLPPWGVDDKQIYALFNGTHKALSYLFVTLIALHVLATLKHVFVDRDGVLNRIWPLREGVPREVVR